MRNRPTNSNDSDESTPGWSPAARSAATVWILFHVAAVIIAPWSSPPPSSDLSRSLASLMRPYLKALSLENGYRFFAPNPDPSHLIRYELLEAGQLAGEGTFPDRSRHWPRLLYHRYFMVAEMMASLIPPPVSSEEMARWNDDQRQFYAGQRQHAEQLIRGVARDLLRRHPGADAVRLFLVTHDIATPLDVLSGNTLRDPRFYNEFLIGEYSQEKP